MVVLTDRELMKVEGGGLTATFLNALARCVSTVMNLGKSLGTSIRRIISGKVCPL